MGSQGQQRKSSRARSSDFMAFLAGEDFWFHNVHLSTDPLQNCPANYVELFCLITFMTDGYTPISWTYACRPSMEPCPIIRFILSIQKQRQQQEHTLNQSHVHRHFVQGHARILFETHTVPWTVPFSTGFLLYSVQAIPSNFLSSMRPFWKSNMLNGKMPGILYMYIYTYTCTYIYIFLTWQCLQSLHLYFLICSRANYHDPHFMTNFALYSFFLIWEFQESAGAVRVFIKVTTQCRATWWNCLWVGDGWLTVRDFRMYRIQHSTNSNMWFEHVVKYVE